MSNTILIVQLALVGTGTESLKEGERFSYKKLVKVEGNET